MHLFYLKLYKKFLFFFLGLKYLIIDSAFEPLPDARITIFFIKMLIIQILNIYISINSTKLLKINLLKNIFNLS